MATTPTQTLVLYAHPFPSRSSVTRALRDTLIEQPGVQVRDLYALYPDFDVDIAAEQQALLQADLIVWLTPVYWYSVPALMKHWFDQVLCHGWAYGHGTQALQGKTAWWVCSAGAPEQAYGPAGQHGQPFEAFTSPIAQLARYCGMRSLPSWVVHGGHSLSTQALQSAQDSLQAQWQEHAHTAATTQTATHTGSPT